MPPRPDGFDRNVFINCPFDADYLPLVRSLVFTVLACGFQPRIATERSDSGEVRVEKIRELIQSSRLSIHDLSRMEPLRPDELPGSTCRSSWGWTWAAGTGEERI